MPVKTKSSKTSSDGIAIEDIEMVQKLLRDSSYPGINWILKPKRNYSKNHLTLCERLQEPLIYAIENLIHADKKLDQKKSSANNTGKSAKISGFEVCKY